MDRIESVKADFIQTKESLCRAANATFRKEGNVYYVSPRGSYGPLSPPGERGKG